MKALDQPLVGAIAAQVLAEVIVGIGQRIANSLAAVRGHRHSEDSAIARWFDTYRLTDRILALPGSSDRVVEWLLPHLKSDEIQAVLHELLAARLTDAPEVDIERIHAALELTLYALGPPTSDVADVTEELFEYFDFEICTLVGRLQGAEPAFWQEIRSEATSARLLAVLNAIERHVAVLSPRPDVRAETSFLTRYRRHVVEQHGKIEPPDFERRRRVLIAKLYVPPGIVELALADANRRPRELSLWELDKELDRTVLLGDPGGGKTTAASVLMHRHASDDGSRIPFLVTLREFAAQDPPQRSVAGYIEHNLEVFYQCPSPAGLVDRLLLTGRAIVIFDGLDELLDTSRRAEVSARVERFCTEYPLTVVMVTSRLVGYDQARLDDRVFTRYRIGGFSDDLIAEYVAKWFGQEEGIDDPGRWADAFLEESATIPDLRTNPLMLALMCILYRGEGSLPRNRAEIYEQCSTLLFRKWDARRRIHAELRAGHQLEPALRHLAWWLFSRDQPQPAVTERELTSEAATFLLGVGFEDESEAREAAGEFVAFCRGRMWVFSDTGTTPDGQDLYSFTHRTFLEFFGAAHLAYNCDTPEQLARALAPRAARQEWEVVGELAVQIKDNTSNRGVQRIYTAMLGERRRRTEAGRGGVLQFLARCLRSADPSPPTIRQLSKEIFDRFFARDPNQPTAYEPMCWLLASCVNCADIVHRELSAYIAEVIAADDDETRLTAFHLLFWLTTCLDLPDDSCPHVPLGSPIRRYWEERQLEYFAMHRQAIRTAAESDTGVRVLATSREAIDLESALNMRGGINPFFKDTPRRVFDICFVAPLPNRILSFIEDPARHVYLLDDIRPVGRYFKNHPEPPWLIGPTRLWRPEDWPTPAQEPSSYPKISRDEYLGAAVIALVIVESMRVHEIPSSLGPLSALQPYVLHRWQRGSDAPLPTLPVPANFQQLFRQWAANTINFTDQGQGSI